MATVTVLKCPTPDGAEALLGHIKALQSQHLITLVDAAVVSWPAGQKAPKTRQLVNMVAVGAAAGAIGGAFRDYGIDDTFIKRLRAEVTEGTSALFLMTSGAVIDRVGAALKGQQFEILATNLSEEQ